MKNWIIIIFIAGFNCGSKAQCIEDYKGFNDFLGPKESEILSVLNHSFDTILQSVYPDIPDFQNRIRVFLENYAEQNDFPARFFSDSASFKSLKIQLESSGFRKDVYLYDEEDYDSKYDLDEFIPERDEPEPSEVGSLHLDLNEAEIISESEVQEYSQDSTNLFNHKPKLEFYMNPDGKFWYGLGKYSCSVDIIEVIELVNNQNRISLGVLATGMQETDLYNAFIKQAIIAQFYIPALLRFEYSEEPK